MNIGAVERDTGLSKDTLRMWERRYAFPAPERDGHGERVYPQNQVKKLRLIKHLMQMGYRPGKIVGRSLEELQDLSSGDPLTGAGRPGAQMEDLLELIKTHQPAELRHRLAIELASRGLKDFVIDLVVPLNSAVGDAWMRGRLAVFEEHLYSEMMRSLLRNAISAIQPQGPAPRVVLTSLPGEKHSLGLLMAEALLVVEGACCMPFGNETPVSDVVDAAASHRADIVALSFSASFPEHEAARALEHLRELLPGTTDLWAGGAAVGKLAGKVAGCSVIGSLDEIKVEIGRWRAERER